MLKYHLPASRSLPWVSEYRGAFERVFRFGPLENWDHDGAVFTRIPSVEMRRNAKSRS